MQAGGRKSPEMVSRYTARQDAPRCEARGHAESSMRNSALRAIMPGDEPRVCRIARHERGHYIAARALGFTTGTISLEVKDPLQGEGIAEDTPRPGRNRRPCAVASSPLDVSALAREQRIALPPINPAFAACPRSRCPDAARGAGVGCGVSRLHRRDPRWLQGELGDRLGGTPEALPRITCASAHEARHRADGERGRISAQRSHFTHADSIAPRYRLGDMDSSIP
jgi:hypothetical protein